MGQLRDRMEQDLKLRGVSPATIRNYLLYGRKFAAFFMYIQCGFVPVHGPPLCRAPPLGQRAGFTRQFGSRANAAVPFLIEGHGPRDLVVCLERGTLMAAIHVPERDRSLPTSRACPTRYPRGII
jgi:hypothetical protein